MDANNISLFVFHDERIVRQWLYHGFILCKTERLAWLRNELASVRKKSDCPSFKRIHFSKLSSGSSGSTRTKTAAGWATLFVTKLFENIWFYLFGVNLNNVDYQFFGSADNGQKRDFRIYNRFFEMGLFSACRYFFDILTERIEITQIFSEERGLDANDPFLNYATYKINSKESNILVKSKCIQQVASELSREKLFPECVDIINLVDIIVGAMSEVLDFTTNKRGCKEVAEKLYGVCRRLSEDPYNKNSRYYKRYAMSFFPRTRQRKSQIINYGIRPPEDQFYQARRLLLYKRCLPGLEEFV
jgi:hypothetical protein